MGTKIDYIVSLGNKCWCSVAMRQAGVRRFSGPLDWLVSRQFRSVLELFDCDFEDFLTGYVPITFTMSPNGRRYRMLDTKYDVELRHELRLIDESKKDALDMSLNERRGHYIRRCKRIKEFMSTPCNILFMRETADEWHEDSKIILDSLQSRCTAKVFLLHATYDDPPKNLPEEVLHVQLDKSRTHQEQIRDIQTALSAYEFSYMNGEQ